MNRRSFIRGLAAALPAGTVSQQVACETDPVRAALLTLAAALDSEAGNRNWSAFASRHQGVTPFLNVQFVDASGKGMSVEHFSADPQAGTAA